MTRSLTTLALVLGLLVSLPACEGASGLLADDDDPTEPTEAPTEAERTAQRLYDPDHVVEIELTIAPEDAAALASETNDLFSLLEGEDCLDDPWSGPFNWYPADITVDGELVTNVGLRKKGLIGSLSSTKPSLKVKFDKFEPDQALGGLERLTLNNSVSDPSLVKQCLGYRLFAAAGIAAPRCNFAHVTANGTDLGIYVHVEPLKREFLRWAYDGDDDGDLYEGTLSDFRPGWTTTFGGIGSTNAQVQVPEKFTYSHLCDVAAGLAGGTLKGHFGQVDKAVKTTAALISGKVETALVVQDDTGELATKKLTKAELVHMAKESLTSSLKALGSLSAAGIAQLVNKLAQHLGMKGYQALTTGSTALVKEPKGTKKRAMGIFANFARLAGLTTMMLSPTPIGKAIGAGVAAVSRLFISMSAGRSFKQALTDGLVGG
jgi:hypothetical protein